MDVARSQLVRNLPEEYVRQDVLRSLMLEYGYPRLALLSEEPVARGTSNRQRADVLVELPAEVRDVHEVIVRDGLTANDEPDPSYASIVGELNARLGDQEAVRFVEVPEALDVTVSGKPVVCRVLGFKEEGQALGLWLRLAEPIDGLPPELCLHVLGYGMTRQEREVARSLGLPAAAPNATVSEEFDAEFSELFLMDEGLNISPGGSVAETNVRGWAILRTDWRHWYGALCLIDTSSRAWEQLLGARVNQLRRVPLHDGSGRMAHRDNLDALRSGERVFILPCDDGLPVEGVVQEITEHSVLVDRGEQGTVEATLTLQANHPWVMGRVPTAEESVTSTAVHRRDDRERTFIVVECKAPHVSFSEEVKNQGLGYARTRGAKFLVLTNGDWRSAFFLDGREAVEVEDIPTYIEALSNRRYEVTALKDERNYEPLPTVAVMDPDFVRFHARNRTVIGADVPEHIWRPILVLDDILLRNAPLFREPQAGFGVTLAEDLGLKWHEPGDAGGGTFPGEYRDFLVRDAKGREVVFGLRVSSSQKTVGHPTWGNRTGSSMLVCCLSFGSVYHPVMVYRLDRFLEVRGERMHFRHSGVATVGKGAAKADELLAFVSHREPELVSAGRIVLGSLPLRSDAAWDEMSDWALRLARYVVLRHAFKEGVRKQRRSGSRPR